MRRNQRGVALVLVLWIIVLLSAVVVSFVSRMQIESLITRNIRVTAECEQAARSAVEMGLDLLLTDSNDYDGTADGWAQTGEKAWRDRLKGAFPGMDVTLSIWDEGSRINLNTADEGLLKRLFKNDPVAVDSLLDWRDLDSDARPSGAEQSFYAAESPPGSCRDGLLVVTGELKQVRGIEPHYKRIAALVTAAGQLNANTMPIETFQSLCTGCGIERYVAERLATELRAFREGGNRFTGYDDLRRLPSMHQRLIDQLQGLLVFEGTYNINTTPREALRMILIELGAEPGAATAICERAGRVETLDALSALLASGGLSPEATGRAMQILTFRSAVFGVKATVSAPGNQMYSVTALVRRYRERPDSPQWHLQVIEWQIIWNNSGATGARGDEEPSGIAK